MCLTIFFPINEVMNYFRLKEILAEESIEDLEKRCNELIYEEDIYITKNKNIAKESILSKIKKWFHD